MFQRGAPDFIDSTSGVLPLSTNILHLQVLEKLFFPLPSMLAGRGKEWVLKLKSLLRLSNSAQEGSFENKSMF